MKKIIASVFVVALLLTACGGGGDEAQIKATFDNYVNAMKSGDYARLQEALGDSAPSEEEFNMMAGFMKDMNFEINDIKVDGDTATAKVSVKGTVMGQDVDQTSDAKFKKVDGKWVPEEMGTN